MKEYLGHSAKKFQQTRGKTYLLNPAVSKHVPKAKRRGENFLEIGCADGFFCSLAIKRGYHYFGLDISRAMIDLASKKNPRGQFIVASATNFSKSYPQKFSLILISQLFPAFKKRNAITKTLSQAKKVLALNGTILIGVSHPNFDRYMEKGLFENKTVETEFSGYFNSGKKMRIKHIFNGEEYFFEDYHWSLEDYSKSLKAAGLVIREIDECRPTPSLKKVNEDLFLQRSKYPTYLLLVCG